MAGRWAAAAAVAILAAGCIPRAPETVSLRMRGTVPDASVTIDDRYLGALAYVQRRGVALPVGTHRITVEKAGYFPWDRLVEAKIGGGPILLDVQLVQVPD
jgi:hypothetical protein